MTDPVWKNFTHTLAFPVTVGEGSSSRTIKEIIMREPTQAAVEAIDEAGVGASDSMSVKQVRITIEQLSGQPTEVIGKLHVKDFSALGAYIAPLLASFSEAESPGDTSTVSPPKSPPS